ncbi:DUF1534 domain-containing protein [Pseudomonas syringae]|nr:DUF1534 domain-containing protein [Pseudomonas syringae]PYD12491.1 hypothetical protein DND47_22505 [Pseudomonas syringae pv. syringae]MCF5363336.1 DUF1534 domain-containing protein [Pseudomonas syringae]MCF5393403.1 DUF1534 domain-containing protein [Pseudomonas syringae]MCF5401959.1 DUF1534 domain-containing protein [Pseudomonas syringae]
MSTNGICSSCTWCVDRGVGGGYDYRSSRSAPHLVFRPGRGASRTAYPRGAWAR